MSRRPRFSTKRVYDPPAADDGVRVLVDRLWPRGLKRGSVALDEWFKELGPSTALRRWFGHKPARWAGFVERYHEELDARPDQVAALRACAGRGPVTLLFAAKDPDHNNALALQRYLEQRAGSRRASPRRTGGVQRGFAELEQVHHALGALFLRHQEALLARQLRRAVTSLASYAAALRRHARDEERWLLPAYERRRRRAAAGQTVAGEIFIAEHRLMLRMLDELLAAARTLAKAGDPPAAELLALLDAECTFKRLVEHHHRREDNVLFPRLQEWTTPAERRRWIARCLPLSRPARSATAVPVIP